MLVVTQMDMEIVTLLAELHEHGDEMIVEKSVAVVCVLIEMAVRKVSVTVEYKLILYCCSYSLVAYE